MRILAQGIVFVGKNLLDFRSGYFWVAHHDGVGGEISKTLGPFADKAGQTADNVEGRKAINRAEHIADDDLADLKA